jgi:ribulose-phosphate 3-epimerase
MLGMEKFPIQICPSILSGDFGNLAEEAQRLEQAGADAIHVDIMDGHFVPNLTLGPKALSAIRRATRLFLDVHIMIYNPFDFVEVLVQSGADRITFHFEATEDVEDTLSFIRKCGKKAGLAFRPETSASMIPKYLDKSDMILLMTVSPGFGGQKFMPEVLEKVKFAREACEKRGIKQGGIVKPGVALPPFDIQVDGGITQETAVRCVKAGANILVSGNYLYEQKDMKKAIEGLRHCL